MNNTLCGVLKLCLSWTWRNQLSKIIYREKLQISVISNEKSGTCVKTNSNSVAFLGWVINMTDNPLNTCVCREKTNKKLLLHYQSHIDNRYKRYLIKTMLDHANRLSSSPDLFWKEFQDLRTIFLKLKYPEKLIDSIFQSFHVSKT